jgi:aspartate/methionine/tyrosine aminotransferase
MNLLDTIQPFYVMELLTRAKALEQAGADIVHMEIGEPDFPSPPLVVQAGIEFLAKGEVKYTPAAGLPALREAIARFYRHSAPPIQNWHTRRHSVRRAG